MPLRPGEVRAQFAAKDGRLVTIRALRRSDLGSLVRFAGSISREKAANRELGIVSLDGRVTTKEERSFLNSIFRGNRSRDVVSLIAVVDGSIVGHADVWRRKPRDVRHTGVFGIVIQEGFRDLGIGERLMTEVLRESKRIGVWLVELTAFTINDRAIHLYEKLGFRRVGVVPNKVVREGRCIDELVMYADLRGTPKSFAPRRRQG